VFQLIA